jgi:hypothetical protein
MSSRTRFAQLAAVFFVAAAIVVTATGQGLYQLSDDEIAGPEQPVQFSHLVHAGNLKIDCQYCHTTAARTRHATVPAVSVCMGCHQWVKQGPSAGSEAEIQKIHDYFARGESIPWVRIHRARARSLHAPLAPGLLPGLPRRRRDDEPRLSRARHALQRVVGVAACRQA